MAPTDAASVFEAARMMAREAAREAADEAVREVQQKTAMARQARDRHAECARVGCACGVCVEVCVSVFTAHRRGVHSHEGG